MAGMEQLEIHSKSYLVRWVNAKPGHTISWTVQPHKRSINFALFKHPGHLASFAHFPSVGGLPPLVLQPEQHDEPKGESIPEVVEKLTGIGLKQVINLGKCEADRATQGKYEVPVGEAGNYALVFDNTFSKNTSKTVAIFLLTYPTNCQNQIQFGAQIHHSQAMASAMSMAPPLTSRKSPKLKAKNKEMETLRQIPIAQMATISDVMLPENTTLADQSSSIHTGILQKRRRKKHQGYARRFFCLDFTSSTLSYYHDRNSSALRGAIPLSLAAIGANAKTREISIDSGTEIWHLKASSNDDFVSWKKALETASRKVAEASTPGRSLSIHTGFWTPGQPTTAEDQEWARLEGLLSKIAGTRDSIRRLCLDTLSKPSLSPPSQGSMATTPVDGSTEDYFNKTDERRPFWKRKVSTPGTPTSNVFKRSASSQLSVPSGSSSDPTISNGSTLFSPPTNVRNRPERAQEDGMHDHMKALLHDLDNVVHAFATIVNESKQRRLPVPSSAISRMSLQSVESQEYFDAEDSSGGLLNLPDHSDEESKTEEEADSETSSDVDEGASYLPSNRAMRSGSLTSLLPPKAKSLAPLPLEKILRRNMINAPTVTPPSLIGFLRKNVGKDLSTITMPVSANEPLSLLQRASENLEYSPLLDQAVKSSDPTERLLYVTAFVISQLANARPKERSVRKPFNPMLGETYELVREDLNFRFIAEKVSHHPVQLAYHAESTGWALSQSPLPSQKFWGKSSEIITDGKARLVLHTTAECYSWSAPACFLRNILAGEKYVEPVGSMTVYNETTNAKAVVNFKSKGMFGGRSEDVEAQLFDPSGTESPLGLIGTWTQSLCVKEEGKANTSHTIWTAGALLPKSEKHYGMTVFAATLNEITAIEKNKMAPTDSRLRQDQRALEDGNADLAEELKTKLEEAQRSRRREMEADSSTWKPRWFTRVEHGGEAVWKLKIGSNGYWEQRTKGEWTDVVDVLQIE